MASFGAGLAGSAAERVPAHAAGWEVVRTPATAADPLTEAVALWQAHETEAALLRARSVRDGTDDLVLEGRASLLLGQWLARAGRHAEAGESLRRHLRTGTARDEDGRVWLGTSLLASGEPAPALAQFRLALGTAEAGETADRGLRIARALYGIALAADLLGEALVVAESIARARQHDREGLVRAACAGALEPPVLEPEHASYLCLLAAQPASASASSASASESRPSVSPQPAASWSALSARGLTEPWASRVKWHAEARPARDRVIDSERGAAEAPVRIVALAARASDGEVPTPVADAALQIAARVRELALQACVSAAEPRSGTRVGLRARFSPGGRLQALELARPVGPRWVSVLECLETELKSQWIVPPSPGGKATLVEVELIFGR